MTSGTGPSILRRLNRRRPGVGAGGAVRRYIRRSPGRAVMVLGMTAVVSSAGLLLAVTSFQAFLMVSHHSSTSWQAQLSQAIGQPTQDAAQGTDGELAAGSGSSATTGGTAPTAPVGVDEIQSVYGIRVHNSLAADLRALIDAAKADGIVLSGWGWRDNATQIRLRKEHCGTSDYAIYRMPSSQCRPPTARPGRSQHERGLAIDFTYNGQSISTQRSPGFKWLNANAATYGLKNLASEPWHWSTTGR